MEKSCCHMFIMYWLRAGEQTQGEGWSWDISYAAEIEGVKKANASLSFTD